MKLRATALRLLADTPVYRFVPVPAVRTYAAVRHLERHDDPGVVCAYVERVGVARLRHFSVLWRAARAAFRAGRDDLLEALLTRALDRYPAEPMPHLIRSDLELFRGEFEPALRDARHALLLDPGSEAAAARIVRLAYETLPRAEADDLTVTLFGRFPGSAHVQWAVSKHCFSDEQFERVMAVWGECAEGLGRDVAERGLRPLATAAARVERFDDAVDLYAQAILLRLEGVNAGAEVREKRLAGRSAWAAIDDTCDALRGAGVPFFFAAGTALGLLREGGPLDHDDDIDIGVFDGDWDQERLVELFVKDPRFVLDINHPRHTKVYLRHRAGCSLDVWRFYEQDGTVWHDGLFTRWGTSPFSVVPRTIAGREVPLPDDGDRYLTENYGDWRVPDGGFDAFTDAPNVQVTWPEYLDYHRLRRAYLQTTAGKLRAAERQLVLARARLVGTASGRRLVELLSL